MNDSTPSTDGSQDRIETVRRIFAKIAEVPVEKVAMDKTFEEMELDSLLALEVVARIEKTYHVRISEEMIGRVRTLNDIVALLADLDSTK